MGKRILYRYDDEDYADGKIILPGGDSLYTITADRKAAEAAIRAAMPNGTEVRSKSIYTWENEKLARGQWEYSKKKFLYELEVDEAHINFRGDLNYYTAAVDATQCDASPDEAVKLYWSGEESSFPPWTKPRMEVLVSQARVIRKLMRR